MASIWSTFSWDIFVRLRKVSGNDPKTIGGCSFDPFLHCRPLNEEFFPCQCYWYPYHQNFVTMSIYRTFGPNAIKRDKAMTDACILGNTFQPRCD